MTPFHFISFLPAVALQREDAPGVNTLVMATGDGNNNYGYATFVDAAREAARSGWRVEVSLHSHFV